MGRRPSRQRLRRSLIALPILLVAQASLSVPSASADPAQIGEWGAPFDLGVIGIHATLLRDGRVLLFDYPSQPGTRAKVWDPATGDVVDVSLGGKHDLFCSGHSVLPDGRVLVVGGTRWEAHGLTERGRWMYSIRPPSRGCGRSRCGTRGDTRPSPSSRAGRY